MKLIVDRKPLLDLVNALSAVVERRQTIPILGNIVLDAKNGFLSGTTSDLERMVTNSIEAQVSEPGRTSVSAHLLADIVKRTPEGCEISFSLDSKGDEPRLLVQAGRIKAALSVLSADDFPIMNKGIGGIEFVLSGVELVRAMKQTRFAISTEETRYYLCGICVHLTTLSDKHALRFVATDGHRLAATSVPLPDMEDAPKISPIIIPRKTVETILRLIGSNDPNVEVYVSPSLLHVKVDRLALSSKLIDGTFPDYMRVIPTGNDKIVTIGSNDLATTVDRVTCILTDRANAIKLSFGGKDNDNEVGLWGRGDNGNAIEDVCAAEYAGEPVTIGFNGRYLREMLENMPGTVQMKFADGGTPMVISMADDTYDTVNVLMPMRVG